MCCVLPGKVRRGLTQLVGQVWQSSSSFPHPRPRPRAYWWMSLRLSGERREQTSGPGGQREESLVCITMTVTLMTMGLLKLKPYQQWGYRALARLKTWESICWPWAGSSRKVKVPLDPSPSPLHYSSRLTWSITRREAGSKGGPEWQGCQEGTEGALGWGVKREKSLTGTPATSCQRFSRPGQTTGREAPSKGSWNPNTVKVMTENA